MATTPPVTPPNMAPGMDVKSIQDVLDAFRKLSPVMKDFMDMTQGAAKNINTVKRNVDGLSGGMRSAGNELRQAMRYADSMEESISAIAEYERKMGKQMRQAKDWDQVLAIYKKVYAEQKNIIDKGLLSKKNSDLMRRNLSSLAKQMKDLDAASKGAFKAEVVDGFVESLEETNRVALKLAKNLKGIRTPGLAGDLQGAHKAMRHLFNIKIDPLQKYHEHAQVARERRKQRKAEVEGRHEDFERKFRIHESQRSDARFRGSIKPSYAANAKQEAMAAAKEAGYSASTQKFLGQQAYRNAMGTPASFMDRARQAVLARGSGSTIRGVGSWVANSAEGLMGGASEMAGVAAPLLAALEVIKMAFNKNQKMNSDVYSSMGTGGLFANPGMSAIDAFRNTRNSLNGPLYSRYGVGYEKNLSIGKAMVESGWSVSDLSRPSGDKGRDGNGFQKSGGFRDFQLNAYAYGRVAGMDPSQTTAETIKLVTQYKQSLGATHDYFVLINKEASRAGISTTRYIQIMDDVNSHFDRWNKSLGTTIDAMSLLASTGRNTAEDIKDAMSAVTNNGKEFSLENSAYLGMQLLSNKGDRSLVQSLTQTPFDDAVGGIKRAFEGTNVKPEAIQALVDKRDLIGLNSLAGRTFSGDNLKYKAANASIRGFDTAASALDSLAPIMAEPNTGKAGLMWATRHKMLGNNQTVQTLSTYEAIKEALRLTSGRNLQPTDMLDEKKFSVGAVDPATMARFETLGGDPAILKQLHNMSYDVMSARSNVITGADTGHMSADDKAIFDETHGYLSSRGLMKGIKAGDYGGQQKWAKDPKNQEDMMHAFQEWNQVFTDMMVGNSHIRAKVTQQDKDDALAAGANIASSTRTTADIFHDAFESLFNTISTPLDIISRILARTFGSAPGSATTGTINAAAQEIDSGKYQATVDAHQQKLEDIQNQLASKELPEGITRESLEKQRDQLNKQKDDLQTAISHRGHLDMLQDSLLQGTQGDANATRLQFDQKAIDAGEESVAAFMKVAGIKSWGAGESVSLKNPTQDMLDAAKNIGLSAGITRSPDTLDPRGNMRVVYNNTTTHNYSTDYTQNIHAQHSNKDAGETPGIPQKGKSGLRVGQMSF